MDITLRGDCHELQDRDPAHSALEVVIFVGLQGCGKTSFYRRHFATTHAHISKDLMRSGKNRAARQERQIVAALGQGRPVVIDNTNPSRADRVPLIELGHRYGAQVIGYYFAEPIGLCLERNRQRTGRARVPDVAIYATRKRLELPSYDEGFDRLFLVHADEDGAFAVHPWGAQAEGQTEA